MHSSPSSSYSFLAATGLLAVILLPSCSLPPGIAWREIQRDGLLPFIANGMSAPKAQPNGTLIAGKNTPAQKIVEPSQPKVSTPAVALAPAPKTPFPPAYAVQGLVGYVRTPFTNPPRLVDVRGMAPGSKVVCPYSQRPFVVPATAVSEAQPKAMVAVNQPKPKPKPTPAPAAKTSPEPAAPKIAAAPKLEPKRTPAPAPNAAPAPTPAPVAQPKPKPADTPKVAATTPPPARLEPLPSTPPAKTQPAPAPAPAPAAKLPFGTPIVGRPGFVNSPFADKHQLVDVTGLSVGTEVKCPYTGKLFRVPPQQQAKK